MEQLTNLQSFHIAFELSRTVVFEVSYYRLGTNNSKHFSTSASEFNRPKSDYNRCGQAQPDLCKGAALRFYNKWDTLHLSDLTIEQHNELVNDLAELGKYYNAMLKLGDHDIPFYHLKKLSMQPIKKTTTLTVLQEQE